MPSETPPNAVRLSIEFFPPRDQQGMPALLHVGQRLLALNPEFYSLTYGAGGSSKQRTLEGLAAFRQHFPALSVAGHLTCVGATKAETDMVMARYADLGVNHIVALRGDPPEGAGAPYTLPLNGYASSVDLIAAIRRQMPETRISVGAYPEKHPESSSLAADILYLKRKQDAGASEAITQFFFDNEAFLRFRDACRRTGVHLPILPGLLPIHNFSQIRNFASKCGTHIPDALAAAFTRAEAAGAAAVAKLAAKTTASQIETLRREGIHAFHFYALNRAEGVLAACQRAGLAPMETETDDRPAKRAQEGEKNAASFAQSPKKAKGKRAKALENHE